MVGLMATARPARPWSAVTRTAFVAALWILLAAVWLRRLNVGLPLAAITFAVGWYVDHRHVAGERRNGTF
jgi:hypothetical protein